MIWTKRKPEKAGWYWWRKGRRQYVLCITPDGYPSNGTEYVVAIDGEWSSEPIQEPKEAP